MFSKLLYNLQNTTLDYLKLSKPFNLLPPIGALDRMADLIAPRGLQQNKSIDPVVLKQ